MKSRKKHDATALIAALGKHRPPLALTLEGRVRLIDEIRQALLEGRLPSREAALFVGGALGAWLVNGGDLARDWLEVVKPKSHRTASKIWRDLQAAALHQDEGQENEMLE